MFELLLRRAPVVLLLTMVTAAGVASVSAQAQTAPETRAPQVLWDRTVSGNSFCATTPVAAGKYVLFSGSASVTCVDRDGGSQLWEVEGDFAHSRPAVLDDLVVTIHERGLQGIDLPTGDERWRLDLIEAGLEPTSNLPVVDASVTIDGAEGFVGTRTQQLVCFDPAVGKVLWISAPAPAELWQPRVLPDRVLCAAWGKALVCFSRARGEVLWQTAMPGIGALVPEVHDGVTFVACHDLTERASGVAAVDIASGKLLWKTDLSAWGGAVGGPLWAHGRLVAGCEKAVVGLEPGDGKILWHTPVERFGYHDLATDAQGRIYAGSSDGQLLVVNAADGACLALWDLNFLEQKQDAPLEHVTRSNVSGREAGTTSCPAVVGDRVYLLTTGGWAVALEMPALTPKSPK